jgi:hypothetical protein
MSSYREAWNAATKEGDRHMRCYGGTEWSKADFSAADAELTRQYETTRTTMQRQMKGIGQTAAVDETG